MFSPNLAQGTSPWSQTSIAQAQIINYSTVYGSIFAVSNSYQSTTGRPTIIVPRPIFVEIYNASATAL
jgi:hypothetical protein